MRQVVEKRITLSQLAGAIDSKDRQNEEASEERKRDSVDKSNAYHLHG